MIEIQRQRPDAGVIAGGGRLCAFDPVPGQKERLIVIKPPGDALHAGIPQPPGQVHQVLGLQQRIAAALKVQIAHKDAALDFAHGQKPGLESVIGAEDMKGGNGGRNLGRRRRNEQPVVVAAGQPGAAFKVQKHIADVGAGKAVALDQGVGADRPGRGIALDFRDIGGNPAGRRGRGGSNLAGGH